MSTTRWRQDDVESIYADSPTSDVCDRSSWEDGGSYSTLHTAYSVTPKPSLARHDTDLERIVSYQSLMSDVKNERRASVDTYASTDDSDLELEAEDEDEDEDEDEPYDLLEYPEDQYCSHAIPATPRDFAELFPSPRKLAIAHDDSTIDGNMNLRVDTLVETDWSSRKENLTLFHLKMNDLKTRDFSLRRYCRDSGREVCHTLRKYQKPMSERQRPVLIKSFSSAFNTIRKHHAEDGLHLRHLQRNDSGYGSVFVQENRDDFSVQEPCPKKPSKTMPSNTIKLEFSNYANVELKRRGTRANKRYQFEYWGHQYTWKRRVRQNGEATEVSFHLTRKDKPEALAHIVPVALTKDEARSEELKGGWIPPCSMWITDVEILSDSPDHADLVVASGLVALVDDAIKRRWQSTTHQQMLLPLIRCNSFRLDMQYIGPKRLIDEVFNRHPHPHPHPHPRATTT